MSNLDNIMALVSDFSAPNVFNPWRDDDPLDAGIEAPGFGHVDRRTRLYQHFSCAEPAYLLIGEAPGYQGCHFSGVPFTNEKLILDGVIPRVTAKDRITSRDKPWSEPSATIVWRVLHVLGIAEHTVMWNAFAWHPHKAGEPMSNRRPSTAEVVSNAAVLRSVIEHFKGARIIAVGGVAADIMRRIEIPLNGKVRHPSMGGAHEFEDGMGELVR